MSDPQHAQTLLDDRSLDALRLIVMKGLSLTQPWASLVAIGAKQYETRSWSIAYRGLVAIHASKGFPKWAKDTCAEQPFLRSLTRAGLSMPELPLGAIVAVGRVVNVAPTERYERDDEFIKTDEYDFGDYSPGRFAWCLAGVVRLPEPIPFKGALGLWTVPPDVVWRIKAVIELPAERTA